MRVALVLGGAACVWADVEAALRLGEFAGVVACNEVGIVWSGAMDAWVSLHAPRLAVWARRRDGAGLPPPKHLVGHLGSLESNSVPHEAMVFLTHRFEGQEASGSSSLFALKVALHDLGFDRAVLCGAPMTAEAAHIRDVTAQWNGARSHRRGWIEALPAIDGRARSMSGWTRTILGAPDAAWMREEHGQQAA